MASTDNNRRSFTEQETSTVKCSCFANGIECVKPTCKRLRSNTIDPLEISPKSIAAASRLDGAAESAPVFKNQKRQRSDAMVDSSDTGMCAAEEDLPPARRSSSCLSNPVEQDHQQYEMFRPRAQYPANFAARIFDSQIGRTADQRAISLDWSRARTDSDASSSTASPMPTPLHTPRSYSVGNLSELHTFAGPSARRSIPGSLSSRSRSRTCSSEWVQVPVQGQTQTQGQGYCDSAYSAMSADMERISLCAAPVPMMHGSPRAAGAHSLSPMPPPPAVFTPIQSMHKVPLLVLQSTAEEENEEEEEEESELVQSFMHVAQLTASLSPTEEQGGVAEREGEEEGEDGRVTMPEAYLLPPSNGEDGRLSTTDENSADAMMFAIEV